MNSVTVLSGESGILLFSDVYDIISAKDQRASLDIIQLSSSLFALYKIAPSTDSLKWLQKVICAYIPYSHSCSYIWIRMYVYISIYDICILIFIPLHRFY